MRNLSHTLELVNKVTRIWLGVNNPNNVYCTNATEQSGAHIDVPSHGNSTLELRVTVIGKMSICLAERKLDDRSGLAASMHAPTIASGSGGRRPNRGNGGGRPPGRGPGKVTKKKKEKKKCEACGGGHHVRQCRLFPVIIGGVALAVTRAIATQSSRSRRHPQGPPQQHPRMNSRQRRTARRLAERQQQQQQMQQQQQQMQQQGQQAQEQLGRQEQAPQEQLPQQQSPQAQRPQPSAAMPIQPAPQEPPEGMSWADQMDCEAEKNAQ
ncbi:hypothetical protein CNMCM7691_001389 [Aspergillus felis]|uniref:Uncharacterized protein n=1 Tax=Aspergillus felis TaxID=1287682 RepID=A0A8H6R1X3_9EURO|nr:hypothetical protein CNMCM7691_001389 [Aspergillus felis]